MSFHSLLFKVSFISYALTFWASQASVYNFIENTFVLLSIASVIYQVLYLFIFRTKDGEKFFPTLAKWFFYFFCSLELFILFYCIDKFFGGHVPTNWYGTVTGPEVWGFEAVFEDGWAWLIFYPTLFVSFLYQGLYKLVQKLVRKKRQKQLNQ